MHKHLTYRAKKIFYIKIENKIYFLGIIMNLFSDFY